MTTENENKTQESGQVERLVRKRRIRAKLTIASQLDDNLVKLQSEGQEISNILTCPGTSIKGDTLDVGHGKGEIGMAMETSFIILYREAF
jgi:hypothetical protein